MNENTEIKKYVNILKRIIEDHEYAKDRVIVRAIPEKDLIENATYDLYGDIAVCVHGILRDDKDIFTTFQVPDADDLKQVAYKNTLGRCKPRIIDLVSSLWTFQTNGDDIFDPSYIMPGKNVNVCLTYEGLTNGATAIFLPGVANRVRELIGEDYYFVPTSKHEVMLHAVNGPYTEKDLTEILNDTIKEATLECDILTRKVYKYSQFNFPA